MAEDTKTLKAEGNVAAPRNVDVKPTIGKVTDAINDKAASTSTHKEHKEKKTNEKEAPITTLAQLRDWHLSRGTEPSKEELDAVRKLEADVAEQGTKPRKSSAKR